MNKYRLRNTGELLTEQELRLHAENMYEDRQVVLPLVIDVTALEIVGADPILEGARPTPQQYESVVASDVVQDSLGNWVQSYVIQPWTQDEITGYKASLVPQQVDMRQARLALLYEGKLSNVDAVISAMPSPDKEAAQIEWEFSLTIQRKHPLVNKIMDAIGLTEDQKDQLFIKAASL